MRAIRILVIAGLASAALQQGTAAQDLKFALFERYLESLRQQAGIPGLSAAIVQDQRIVWERGLGLGDVDRSVAAAPDTPYPIGDPSQTFAAVLALRCLEQADVSLADPVRRWTDQLSEPGTTVRQVLSHSILTEGFRYDPARYAALTPMISYCTGRQAYPKLVADHILDRLAMVDSVPGQDLGDSSASVRQLFDQAHLDRYTRVLGRLAIPYRVDRSGRPNRSEYPPKGLNAATGLVSTVRDLARYDAALDDGVLLGPNLLALAWTNTLASNGATLPTGLGWFVQSYNGDRVVWHFGLLPDAFSSLIIKVPRRNLTLILLANSDGLSAPFPLSGGDVTTSVFGQLFLRTFVS